MDVVLRRPLEPRGSSDLSAPQLKPETREWLSSLGIEAKDAALPVATGEPVQSEDV